MRLIDRPSPNHGPRRDGAPVDMLLLHYTDMATAEHALDRLCDPNSQVSAHYLITRDGRVFHLVPETRRAWHAGHSWWAGEGDINSRSIGVELDNPGHSHGYTDFPEAQMTALIALCRGILARHPIPPHRVLGHSDVAANRKIDPGHRFNWNRLAQAGAGVFPEAPAAVVLEEAEAVKFREAIAAIVLPLSPKEIAAAKKEEEEKDIKTDRIWKVLEAELGLDTSGSDELEQTKALLVQERQEKEDALAKVAAQEEELKRLRAQAAPEASEGVPP